MRLSSRLRYSVYVILDKTQKEDGSRGWHRPPSAFHVSLTVPLGVTEDLPAHWRVADAAAVGRKIAGLYKHLAPVCSCPEEKSGHSSTGESRDTFSSAGFIGTRDQTLKCEIQTPKTTEIEELWFCFWGVNTLEQAEWKPGCLNRIMNSPPASMGTNELHLGSSLTNGLSGRLSVYDSWLKRLFRAIRRSVWNSTSFTGSSFFWSGEKPPVAFQL